MAEMTPQQQNLLRYLVPLLQAKESAQAAVGPSALGTVLDMILPSSQTVEKMSYGDMPFRMPTQSRIPITTDKQYLADLIGVAGALTPAAKPVQRGVQQLVREIQTTAPKGQISPQIAQKVIPQTKVVDESGNPKMMYHGTPESFQDFELGRLGAIFASPDQNFASKYAGQEYTVEVMGKTPNVRPVYVDSKNPFDYENPNHVKAMVKWVKENNPDFQDIAESIGDKVKDGFYYQIERPIVQDAIRSLGFDGFYIKEDGAKNIAVFDPSQIKSAISDPAFTGLLEPQAGAKGFNVVQPGDKVSGLTVREDVPNMSSISASLDDYEILSGIREVPRSAFDKEYLDSLSFENLDKRTKDLAEQIKQSKEINPMIVGVDSKGAYIIEGGHRFDALMSQDTKSIPAVVVIDKSDPPADISSLLY